MQDLIIGQCTKFSWKTVESFAVSTVWCGFKGHKVLFVEDLPQETRDNLIELGFELIEVPKDLPGRRNKFFDYIGRFLMIYRYLRDHPNEFRFVFTADTRDLIFQGNPSTWMEKNLGGYKIVAASEFCRHIDSPPNMIWVDGMLSEVREWIAPKEIYCSGCIAGRAEYMIDLCLAIYLYARNFTASYWGPDQPIYATLLHQKAYADITFVPKAEDLWCINCVNVAHDNLVVCPIRAGQGYPPIKISTTGLPIRPFYDFNPHHTRALNLLWANGIPNLSDFTVLHQFDRIPPLNDNIRRVFTLENLRSGRRPFRLELTKFAQVSE